MAQPKRWTAGEFCWYELGTTDVDGARSFYTSLFGWSTNDVPMGPMGIYTLFRHRDQDLAGMYKLEGPQFAGVPPHWMVYVATDDVDRTVARVGALGGTVLGEPMDVPNVGRIAFLQDPQGAAIAVFQAGEHAGAGRFDMEPHTFGWSELTTADPAAAIDFYTVLFGWHAKPSAPAMAYTEWQVDGRSIGGMLKSEPSWGHHPPSWLNYLAVPDCDGTVAQATALGGRIVMPPREIAGVGRFAVLADPQGARFAVIKLG
jgi:predicted enzyme related to lactoylglutathione lyase